MGNYHATDIAMLARLPLQARSNFSSAIRNEQPRAISVAESAAWRVFDLTISLLILAFMLPFLAVLSVMVFVSDPGPVFYRHNRIGHRGRYFQCLKFRTMKLDGDAILAAHLKVSPAARTEWDATRKLRSDPRVTPLGAVMRKLSLDEFPQLLNVLSGEMSLVGPRPIVEQEVQKYGSYFEHYCRVRPGLTGIWQTSGRSDTSYQQRVTMDVAYVGRKSVAFDLWLMAKTLPAVLAAKGSY
ncbi:sugar transferase [Novosphingobium sp. YAF33]|uniref:sugar transferase n=1 Tax=Novosphingobium sp. YAF33 TaxID=3233082 RepID=UPI003F967247